VTIKVCAIRVIPRHLHRLPQRETASPGGDTLSLDCPGPAIVLVQVTDGLAFRFTSLRRTIRAGLGTEARMIRLPARQEDAERLLDGLAH
jgi:hypothetical protein